MNAELIIITKHFWNVLLIMLLSNIFNDVTVDCMYIISRIQKYIRDMIINMICCSFIFKFSKRLNTGTIYRDDLTTLISSAKLNKLPAGSIAN